MNKNIYCTLDTETVGGASNPTGMYNLGCTIHDKQGNIFATCSLLVMEHYDEIRNDDYAKKNFHLYESRLASGEISAVATEEEALSIVRNLCNFYGVKYVMAYNSGFDFCKTICHKKSFANFCRENGMKSRSGKTCSTSAETVFAYITNNADYTEEHTALSDAMIEMEIFLACVKMKKKYVKNVHQWDYKGEVEKCFPKF